MPAPDLLCFPSRSGVRRATFYPTGSCEYPISHNTTPRNTRTHGTCTCTAWGGSDTFYTVTFAFFGENCSKKFGREFDSSRLELCNRIIGSHKYDPYNPNPNPNPGGLPPDAPWHAAIDFRDPEASFAAHAAQCSGE